MDLEKIEGLVKIIENSSLKQFTYKDDSVKITMSKLDHPPIVAAGVPAMAGVSAPQITVPVQEKAEEGEMEISDASCDKDGISANALKERRISAVFQENRLCEALSPVDNLLLAVPELNRRTAEQELSRLLPAECLNRPVSTLSGGMKRRAALVRAVCFSGTILLMDEPFTGLDKESKQHVVQFVKEYTKNKITIIVTHSETEAKALDSRIYVLTSSNTVVTIQ